MWLFIGIYAGVILLFLAVRRKKVSEKYRDYCKKIILIIFLTNTLAVFTGILDEQRRNLQEGSKLERNPVGDSEKTETLKMKIGGEEELIEIPVAAREYTEGETEALFRQVMSRLDEVIAGENKSLDRVEENLYLPENLEGFPVMITWELSRYDVLDSTGKVYQEVLQKQEGAEDGITVSLTGYVKYKEREAMYGADVRIYPRTKEEQTLKERVMEQVKKAQLDTAEEAYLILPTAVDGRRIIWTRQTEDRSVMILILGGLACVLVVLMDRQNQEKKEKERRLQMFLDYPEIIEEFTMLIEAGMTAKNAWKKITENYKEKRERTGKRAAYEEMLYTWKEMSGGVTEAESYERFGRRCGLVPYMKFGALLSQNLRRGTKGLAEILNMEAIQAFEERKSRAKRLGEEAGTKLLIPMFLMLVIVLLIVIVPAFLSVQI